MGSSPLAGCSSGSVSALTGVRRFDGLFVNQFHHACKGGALSRGELPWGGEDCINHKDKEAQSYFHQVVLYRFAINSLGRGKGSGDYIK
ncbi:hypothetical protein GV64_17165 [Endozoicomonas elysicola]|uniref:Uncharacterized protein n=1 Tax=Endozoicomonas elysicola TaxID=305900 RepID=A0A081KDK2_9GAMM|nr:hypothetical protein GV64_17165 [Endozoicomonas elysicola]